MEHITFERIRSYMEGQLKAVEIAEVEGHIATCDRCHSLFIGMKDIEGGLTGCLKTEAKEGCPEDWEIAASIRHELEPARSKDLTEHINSCDYCLDRAAMYYKADISEEVSVKAPKEWVEKAVDSLQKEKRPTEERVSIFAKVRNFIHDMISTLTPLPAYAVAAVAVILLIWSVFPEPTSVVTIASSQRITFKDVGATPSFAFMGKEEVKAFEGMEVKKRGDNLVFSWRPISGAEVSEFVLREKGIEKDMVVVTVPVKGKRVEIPVDKLSYNERYEWVISGLMEDGREFEAISEFVLGK